MNFLANWINKRSWVTLILIICMFVPLLALSSGLSDNLKVEGFSSPNSESEKANQIIREHFQNTLGQNMIVTVQHKELAPEEPEFKSAVQSFEASLSEYSIIKQIISPYNTEIDLMNPTSKTAFVVVELNKGGGETQKFVDTVQERIQSNSSLNDFDVNITGSDSVYHDYNLASEQAVKNVEMIGLPIVFILLLFVFRSVVAASLPIIMGVLSILGTMGILAIISQYMDLSIMVTNIVTMLGLGISIDYALFMVMRFREELDQHGDIQKAIKETVNHTGRSVLFAGITIVVSLSGLFIPNVMFFRSLAVGGVVVVLFTLILTLTFMPAVLKLLGRRINSLSIPYRKTNQKKLRIEKVLKRPILVLLLVLLLFAPMIIPVFDISIHRPVIATDNLPPQYSSSQGMELVMEKFGLEETFPITLLFEYDTPVLEESNLKEINEFAEKLRTMEHVARVDHLTNVNETTSVLLDNGQDSKMTLMNIILDVAPDKDEARELVKTIRQEIIEKPLNAKTYVTGETATGLDFDRLSIESLPYILLLVVVGTFVLLGIAFKSILIPLKAILMNGLVTAASMGLLVVLFQYGTVPGTEPLPINASTPIILFTVLFGLSMDYEVILISRIKEFYTRGETMENSVIYGVQRTSGMINGAASIMIVVFGVFIFADLQLIQELGVGLAIAVFLDAVVIRSYLVPVTMILLGKWNWWTPRLFKARNNKTSM